MRISSRVESVDDYIAAVNEPTKSELLYLHAMLLRLLPDFEPFLQSGMIGYGKQAYVGPSGRSGEWFHFGLAPGKTGISVYVVPYAEDEPGAIDVKDTVGRASVGKSCIRFKKRADIHLDVLEDLIVRARDAKRKSRSS